MKRGTLLVGLVVVGAILAIMETANPVYAQPFITRYGWVPNVGYLFGGELPRGDMWTFRCPSGGTFEVLIDTAEDSDLFDSYLDPIVYVYDGAGNLIVSSDDDFACLYTPTCGFMCPAVYDAPCGAGLVHSIVVRDYGYAVAPGEKPCINGGGYFLRLAVWDHNGNAVPEHRVSLGGGRSRNMPRWVGGHERVAPVGPLLDDEGVPRFDFPPKS